MQPRQSYVVVCVCPAKVFAAQTLNFVHICAMRMHINNFCFKIMSNSCLGDIFVFFFTFMPIRSLFYLLEYVALNGILKNGDWKKKRLV